MAQGKKIASIPGVADGRVLVGVPTSDELSAEDKVKAFLEGAMSGDVYQVCIQFLLPCPICYHIYSH